MDKRPFLVHGIVNIKGKEFNATSKIKLTVFCRCGNSGNKPYSHVKLSKHFKPNNSHLAKSRSESLNLLKKVYVLTDK